MGYQFPIEETETLRDRSFEEFVTKLGYPVIVVGHGGPETFLLNQKAFELLDQLMLPDHSWMVLEPVASP